jgi:hypothetical protein
VAEQQVKRLTQAPEKKPYRIAVARIAPEDVGSHVAKMMTVTSTETTTKRLRGPGVVQDVSGAERERRRDRSLTPKVGEKTRNDAIGNVSPKITSIRNRALADRKRKRH